MAFADLLEQVGSTGRFQVVHVTLLSMPILMMASHNLMQNFVAAVPPHHCTTHGNLTGSPMSAQDVLRATVPLDSNGKLDSCKRYVHPQWQLLNRNTSEELWEDVEEPETQGCEDGWYYNTSEMSSTIITEVNANKTKYFTVENNEQCFFLMWSYLEIVCMSLIFIFQWDLVCDLRALKQMSQTIYMGGVLVGAPVFGGLSDRSLSLFKDLSLMTQ